MSPDTIPKRISDGLGSCDVLIVVLSPNSVTSGWVEREWHTKYWDEVGGDRVVVIPALIETCEIPILLKHKRYADFRISHQEGIREVLESIQSFPDAVAELQATTSPKILL